MPHQTERNGTMNKIRTLALLVLAGAVFPLWAQGPADEPAPPPHERVRKGPHGRKGPRPDGPADRKRPAPMMEERLAAEYPKEFAEIETLRAKDPAAAEKKMEELRKRSADAREAEMKKVRDQLEAAKNLLRAQFDREAALRKTMIANLEKKIAAEKAAGKDVKPLERSLERVRRVNDRMNAGGKEEYVNRQLKRLTGPAKPGAKRPGPAHGPHGPQGPQHPRP